ncbi:unknown [Collinsella sp. CAG:166]|nr:unknown [Collinsella sp. CAG:166]
MRQALGADRAVQLNLALNGSAGVLNVTVLDKVDDGLDRHGRVGAICRALGHDALGAGGTLPRRLAAYRNTVECMARDIGVVVGNLDDRGMASGCSSHLDVEVRHTLDKRHIAVVRISKQLGHAGAIRVIDTLEHLERALGVAAHGAQHGRRFNTVHTARVGHGHALNVLDDVARAGDIHMIGFATERLARQRRCIGNGNRLGAAERTDELAVQNIAKRGITKGIGRHRYLLLV